MDSNKAILMVAVLVLSVIYLWKNNFRNFPPGPWGYPFLGNLKLLKHKPHMHLTHLKGKYGNEYSIKLGKHRTVVVCSLEGILEGLVKESPKFSGRPNIFSTNLLFNGNSDGGICFTNLSMKYKMKKDFLLQSIDNLCCDNEHLEVLVTGEAERLVFFLLAQSEPCDLAPMLESTILRIMLYLVNGKLYQNCDENFIEIWRTFQMRCELSENNLSVYVPLLHKLQRHNNIEVWERTGLQYEYQRSIINRHKDCFNPNITSDMIDHMLVMLEKNEDMGLFDQEDLDYLFVEISGSGHRTIAITLQWLILYVTSFPDVQKKIHEELQSVVGKERLPRLSDQPYLPYTCAVIMETQRLATVMPFLYPHSCIEDTTFMEYKIPKDTIMLFNIWSLHHDHKYWKHPMKFDPARFLQEDGTLHIPDYFLPFGEGLRMCPGESLADIALFIFSTYILYQTVLSLPAKADLEGDYKGYMLSPKPFKVVSTPRDPMVPAMDLDALPLETIVRLIE